MDKDRLLNIASFSQNSLQYPNSWIGHLPFAAWIIAELSPNIFVELGTHTGNSYFAFCTAVSEVGLPTKCFAVDTWKGDAHAGFYDEGIFIKVNTHNQDYFAGFSRLLRMTFDEAISYFSNATIDLLHIDGLHTYEAVLHDFENWLPKLAPGAVVLFHDTNVRERNFGVWKLWEELKKRYPDNMEFFHSHGLGVLQLNNAPNGKRLAWLEPKSQEKQHLIQYFSALGLHQLERYELSLVKTKITEREGEISQLHQALSEREAQIISLNQNLSEREAQIISLNQNLSEREAQIISLNQNLSEREEALSNLTCLTEERNAILSSISWRITSPIRGFKRRFPWMGRQIRRMTKLVWWTITGNVYSRLKEKLTNHRYNKNEMEFIVAKGLFNTDWYLAQNPDVVAAKVNPLQHFLESGWKEGRDPSPFFNTNWYLAQNLDVAAAKVNPLQHFLESGWKESRDPSPYAQSPFIFILLNSVKTTGVFFNVDMSHYRYGNLLLKGWAFHEAKGIESIEFSLSDNDTQLSSRKANYGISRNDVFSHYREENAKNSGFTANLTIETHLSGDVSMIIHYTDGKTDKFLVGVLIPNPIINPSSMDFLDNVLQFITTPPQSSAPREECIDIIISVYNGYEHIKPLFRSLMMNTREPYRLIVLENCSTDPRVWPLLQEELKSFNDVILIQNDQDLGYIKSVNKGYTYSSNHVVFLNLDVVVPDNWLDRLMGPILTRNDVASTTPFTNSGTICSFPSMPEDNPIFDGLGIAEIDQWFSKIDITALDINLPSSVGFCMGINRNVVNEIGLFDESFGRGYGEENDWALRANSVGYKNIQVTNLFVYHKHGGSFEPSERVILRQRALEKVVTRYPNYPKMVNDFINEDICYGLRSLLVLLISCSRFDKQPILIIDHKLGGGANHYRNELINSVIKEENPLLLYTQSLGDEFGKIKFRYKQWQTLFSVRSLETLKSLCMLLPNLQVFYNNAVSFSRPESIAELLRDLTNHVSKITISFHDYYLICPSYNLIDFNNTYCGIPDINECEKCLPQNPHINSLEQIPSIRDWRSIWGEALENSDEVLCFSNSTSDIVTRAYPSVAHKIVIRPHNVNEENTAKLNVDFSHGLRIGVVGAINFPKGAQIVSDLFSLIKHDSKISLVVIGTLSDVPIPDGLRITGRYQREDLKNILRNEGVNVCCVPSICPETFSYVTEELQQIGLPICCFDLGAPAERIRSYNLGIVVTEMTAKAALSAIKIFTSKNLGGWEISV